MILFHYFIIMILAGLLKQLLELTKLIKRLQHGLNNLHEQKFKHSWQDSFNPFAAVDVVKLNLSPLPSSLLYLRKPSKQLLVQSQQKMSKKAVKYDRS